MTAQSEAEKLLALAELVERSDCLDFGIDADIELIVGNWTSQHHDAWSNYQAAGESSNPPLYQPVNPNRYTASLDAAMTLVPEGWRRSLCDDPDDTGGVIAELWTRTGHAYANASTAALALSAAALRARAVLAKDATHA